MFSLKQKIPQYWRDVAWQASGSSLAQVVGVAGIPILTRLYTPEDFAAQSLFLQVVTLATAVVTWRYEYFVQLPKHNQDAHALNGLVFRLGVLALLVLTPFFWLFQEPLARQLGNADVAPWLSLAPATAVLVSWAIAVQNNAQRHRDFRSSGLSELAGKAAYVLSGVAGALLPFASLGLIMTTAVGAIGKAMYVLLRRPDWAHHPLRVVAGSVARVRRQYGGLATSTVLSHLLASSAVALPQIAISRLYGVDVLGQFALVLATIYLPSGLLGAAIGQVYYQRAAQLWADGETFHALWRNTLRKLLLIGAPVYGVVALVSPHAYPLVFGQQWHVAGEFAVWMSIAAFGSFVSSPMDRTCLVVGAGLYLMLWSILRLVTSALVAWIAWAWELTPTGFILALAMQLCLAYLIDLGMGYSFSRGKAGFFSRSRAGTT